MKFALTILLALGISFTLSAQNIPNGNFEGPPFTWFGTNGGLLSIGGQGKMVQPNGDTLVVKSFAGNGGAFLLNTDKACGLQQLFAIASRPDTFVFQYNFIPFGNDVAGAKIIMTRFDDKLKLTDTLVNETVLITDTVSIDYKRIAFYIGDKYKITGNPDTGFIMFSPSMNGVETPKSYMILDDIDLVNTTSSTVGEIKNIEFVKIRPNPIEDKAVISYDLKTNSAVNIMVYDMSGKQIQVILNTNQNAGTHHTELDVSNLNAGVYLCKAVVEGDIAVLRIVVSD